MARMSWLNASMFHLTINTRFEEGDDEGIEEESEQCIIYHLFMFKQWRHIC